MEIIYFTLYALANSFIFFILGNKLRLNEKFLYIFIASNPFIIIVVTYLFYTLSLLHYWPYIYLLLISLIMIWARRQLQLIFRNIKLSLSFISISMLYIFIYSHDARSHLTVGAPDALASFEFVTIILGSQNTNYQPGLALYLSPVIVSRPGFEDVGTISVFIGLMIVAHIYILLLAFDKRMALLFLLLLSFPIFNQLNLLLIGLSSTTLGVLGFSIFLIIIIYNLESQKLNKIEIPIVFIIIIGIALTTPTLLIYIVPFLLLLSLVYSKILKGDREYQLIWILFSAITAFILIFLDFSINNSFIKNREPIFNRSELLTQLNNVTTQESSIKIEIKIETLLKDFFGVQIREVGGILDLFGWITYICIFFMAIYSIRLKNEKLLALSLAGTYFGTATFIGILELKTFQGRAGLYFMTTFLLIVSYILYINLSALKSFVLYPVFILIFVYYSMWPIEHYRYHDESLFYDLRLMIEKNKIDASATIFSSIPQLNRVSKDFIVENDISKLDSYNCSKNQVMLILDFNTKLLDPVLSRQFDRSEARDTGINSYLEKINQEKITQSLLLEKIAVERDFNLIYANESYKIYLQQCESYNFDFKYR